MKGVVLVVTIVLILTLGGVGCAQPQEHTYTPRYTADQVIYIAQAQYPTAWRMVEGQRVDTPTSISVRYIGGSRAAWEVIVKGTGFLADGSFGTKVLYFYETDGSLRDQYTP